MNEKAAAVCLGVLDGMHKEGGNHKSSAAGN